jgi:hypothetical protein
LKDFFEETHTKIFNFTLWLSPISTVTLQDFSVNFGIIPNLYRHAAKSLSELSVYPPIGAVMLQNFWVNSERSQNEYHHDAKFLNKFLVYPQCRHTARFM